MCAKSNISGYEAHREVHGQLQCYDFLCPAIAKPRVKLLHEAQMWEIKYICVFGVTKVCYSSTLVSALHVCNKVCSENALNKKRYIN